jgi:hypothetical protein
MTASAIEIYVVNDESVCADSNFWCSFFAVFIHPPSVTTSQTSDLLSANASCPSLSPSPSPVPTSLISSHQPSTTTTSSSSNNLPPQPSSSYFCDPRQLTVESSVCSSTTHAELPPLPTLCSGDEEDHKFVLGGTGVTLNANETTNDSFPTSLEQDTLGGLPTFGDFSDLDSEDEFVNGIVNFAPTDNTLYLGDKRQRIAPYTSEEDGFLSEQSLEDLEDEELFARSGLPLCDWSQSETDDATGDMRTKKRVTPRKQVNKSSSPSDSDSDLGLGSIIKKAQANVNRRGETSQAEGSSTQQQTSGAPSQETSESNAPVSSSSEPPAHTPTAPVNRRGRKQSLTEDPSKTFVCALCSRRFRRQQNLNRH